MDEFQKQVRDEKKLLSPKQQSGEQEVAQQKLGEAAQKEKEILCIQEKHHGSQESEQLLATLKHTLEEKDMVVVSMERACAHGESMCTAGEGESDRRSAADAEGVSLKLTGT